MQAMRKRGPGRGLAGTVLVDNACLGGEHPGGKRGRGSENKTPVLVPDEGQPALLKLGAPRGFRKVEVEQWARENLQPGTRMNTGGLGCFRGMEAAGSEQEPRVAGCGKSGCETPGLTSVNTILGNVKRSLNGTCQVSAPRYLAEFQYRFNHRYDPAALLQRLLRASASALPGPRPILLSVA